MRSGSGLPRGFAARNDGSSRNASSGSAWSVSLKGWIAFADGEKELVETCRPLVVRRAFFVAPSALGASLRGKAKGGVFMQYQLSAIIALAMLLASGDAVAAAKAKPDEAAKWDVNAPPLPTRKVAIDVDEGTWISLDVSPDGKTIAFDLLGDIYTMPITGGTATRIAEGLAMEVQPRFSPDGRQIAFTSDRGGGDNIWVMDVTGANKRAITDEKFRLLNNATWSADGQYIAARKHFTTQRSAGTGEIWLYSVHGGSGVALVKKPNEQHQKDLGEPIFSADGSAIYYSKDATPGPIFQYAQDSNGQIFVIERYDMATGKIERVIDGPGGAVRPAPSPDGRYLAFIKRERAKSKLYVKDLQTGIERKIYDDLDRDMQEVWSVYGVYPNMDWLPDSKSLVFWAGGKIRRIDVASGQSSIIPFRVRDDRAVIDPVRPRIDVAPDSFTTRMPRFVSVSPNGQWVVFESVGKLYLKPAKGGEARPLVSNGGDDFELFPAWSRDGSQIVYVSWDDQRLGELRMVPAGGGAARTVSRQPGHYRRPVLSPDGKYLAYEAGSGGFLTSEAWGLEPGIHVMELASGEHWRVADSGTEPQFGAASDRLFFSKGGDGLSLVSTDLYGKDERVHAKGELAGNFSIAPDSRHLVFREDYNLYLMPFLPLGEPITVSPSGNQIKTVRINDDGATYPSWSGNGATINWSLGPTLYSADVAAVLTPGKQAKYTPPSSGVSLAMTVPADKPSGTVALTNARIVTMAAEDGGVIESGTVLVRDNRIVAAGRDVAVPAGAQTVDLAGKTVLPGFIDAHAHGPQGQDDIIPHQNWSAIAHLALGVTTLHDPSSTASEIFPASEYQRAGKYLASRLYSTGEIVYGAKAPGYYAEINSLPDAADHIRRLKAQGAHAIKNYNQPRREQRQQVVKAAIGENIPTVAEGGAQYYMDLTIIADGNTQLEHNLPQSVFYEDVLSFYSQTKVGYTPTLVVTYGGLAADPYWRAHMPVWQHPILSKHVPPEQLQASSVRVTQAPEEDFVDAQSASQAKRLAERGVPVSIGAHGQEEGLAAHWEMWSFVRGGMSPLQALRAATIVPARALGFDKDIGSIESGKLADLVIIDGDPLADIRQSDRITHVMLNGRLYEVPAMREVVTGNARLKPYYWESAAQSPGK